MIRTIDSSVHFIHTVSSIKEDAALEIKYALRGLKTEAGINTDLLIKDIDNKMLEKLLSMVSLDVFSYTLFRHALGIEDNPVIQNMPSDTEPCIVIRTHTFTQETTPYIQKVDKELFRALSHGLCFEWMKINMFEPGINLFNLKYDESKRDLLSTSLMLLKRERNYNPIF